MTTHDYHLTMTTVGIAELKARLNEYLKAVRRGREITVLDRDTPVARILPYDTSGLEVARATRRPGDLKLPRRPRAATDSLAVLVDDRARFERKGGRDSRPLFSSRGARP